MKHLISWLTLSFLAGTMFGCGGGGSGAGNTNSGVPPVTSTVSGIVADKNSIPISGATITVYQHNENTTVTTTTSANGSYSVSGLNTGNFSDHSIYVEKAGFGFYPSISDAAASVGKLDSTRDVVQLS